MIKDEPVFSSLMGKLTMIQAKLMTYLLVRDKSFRYLFCEVTDSQMIEVDSPGLIFESMLKF